VLAPLHDSHFYRPDTTSQPVFVVGLPRCGTTMLRLMLHRHPSLAVLSETWFATRVWERRWAFPMREPKDPFRMWLLEDIVRLLQGGGRQDFPLDFQRYPQRFLAGPPSLSRYLSALGEVWAEQEQAERWGEKTPAHLRYMSVLSRMFPNATFVHIVRDFRDVISSMAAAPFTSLTDPAALALQCRDEIRKACEQEADGVVKLLRIRYEDLLARPEEELEKVGLRFERAMLDFHLVAGAYAPRQEWMAGVHKSLNTESMGRWEADLKNGECCWSRLSLKSCWEVRLPLGLGRRQATGS
jgi:hypothetical protein